MLLIVALATSHVKLNKNTQIRQAGRGAGNIPSVSERSGMIVKCSIAQPCASSSSHPIIPIANACTWICKDWLIKSPVGVI